MIKKVILFFTTSEILFWLFYSTYSLGIIHIIFHSLYDLLFKIYLKHQRFEIYKDKKNLWLYFYLKIFGILSNIFILRKIYDFQHEKIIYNSFSLTLFNKIFRVTKHENIYCIFEPDIEIMFSIMYLLSLVNISTNHLMVLKCICVAYAFESSIQILNILKKNKSILLSLKYIYVANKIIFNNTLVEMCYYLIYYMNIHLLQSYNIEDTYMFIIIGILNLNSDKSFYPIFIMYELYKSFIRLS